MKTEIENAIWYISKLVHNCTEQQTQALKDVLTEKLEERFSGHWYEDDPERGSAYRSICVENGTPERLLSEALTSVGLQENCFGPDSDFLLFIDPFHVSVKNHGRLKVLYTSPNSSPVKSPRRRTSKRTYAKKTPPSSPHKPVVTHRHSAPVVARHSPPRDSSMPPRRSSPPLLLPSANAVPFAPALLRHNAADAQHNVVNGPVANGWTPAPPRAQWQAPAPQHHHQQQQQQQQQYHAYTSQPRSYSMPAVYHAPPSSPPNTNAVAAASPLVVRANA
eukprot:CAMPEP_0168579274 /NCGR_PEP_ID=MMETSP0420-20121227/120_1 /TAXON_ID=498008 /ORGANISM="Pessonella sp." /LENGTH=276 /DNA_ID=CAMNT_0008613201 /DNA_START=122 /DNA_END=952 /DNA_ORIENTATION=+